MGTGVPGHLASLRVLFALRVCVPRLGGLSFHPPKDRLGSAVSQGETWQQSREPPVNMVIWLNEDDG